ncbi:MAG: hypothetical protein WC719_04605 [Patescibacteria group bacterium]|jgi:hypothetical protein
MNEEKKVPNFSDLLQRVKKTPGNIEEEKELISNLKKVVEMIKADDKLEIIKTVMAEELEHMECTAIEMTMEYNAGLHEFIIMIIEEIEREIEELKIEL